MTNPAIRDKLDLWRMLARARGSFAFLFLSREREIAAVPQTRFRGWARLIVQQIASRSDESDIPRVGPGKQRGVVPEGGFTRIALNYDPDQTGPGNRLIAQSYKLCGRRSCNHHASL